MSDSKSGKQATTEQIQWTVLEGEPQGLKISMVEPVDPVGTFLIEFTTMDHEEELLSIWDNIVGMSGFMQLPNTGYELYPALFGFSNASIFPGENSFRTVRVRFEGRTPFKKDLFEPNPDKPSSYRLLIGYKS